MIHINDNFAGGNIQVLDASDPQQVSLSIRNDNQSEFKQWFYFKAFAEVGQQVNFSLKDAKDCAYPEGWEGYQTLCSYDGHEWFRIPTEYKDGELSFQLEFDAPAAFFAYFAPYTYERHMNLVQQVQLHPECEHRLLGYTLDGREMNMLVLGNQEADKNIWIIARQHPGETMAEWFIEGMLDRLLDSDDALSRDMLSKATIYVVPNMNPDGSERGHLRTNAKGINLNREWDKATMELSPEVYLVREQMEKLGVDMFFDVHGDEGLPYNFVAGSEGIPSYNESLATAEKNFIERFKAATPEFQDEYGYPKDEPGKADLSIASSWVGETFKCLSLTLEMPFKDNANHPDLERGWSAQRSQLLGQSMLQPIYQALLDTQ
ncbi:M14-type cytosolic carboxypeptidase [Pleionea sp. CnH1-48]|uniref:M14 family metallopeptidase n=1 Tax=Pleionea sp. CnH1-48 TaxID=2954494 RepID=UPI0020977391|nr:M14-type cytosolic carboxypeptidase [Pleionea sp. CnH1-48]MCO7222990.1 M14-type cytosolic carboxypeptidase [Pleionea sp. CnH1-48]